MTMMEAQTVNKHMHMDMDRQVREKDPCAAVPHVVGVGTHASSMRCAGVDVSYVHDIAVG